MRDDVYVGMLVSRDSLKHYGVGHLNGGHSGRYPWGSGKNPKQHEEKLDFKGKLQDFGKAVKFNFSTPSTKRSVVLSEYSKYRNDINQERKNKFARLKRANIDTSNDKYDIVKSGSVLQRYSYSKNEPLNDIRKYVTLTRQDNRTYYDILGPAEGDSKFVYQLSAKKDLKVAKQDEVSKYLIDTYLGDNTQKMYDFLKTFDSKSASHVTNRLRTDGESIYNRFVGSYVANKSYDLASSFGRGLWKPIEESKNAEIYKHFEKKGYDAIPDLFDMSDDGRYTQLDFPIIVLNPKESLELSTISRETTENGKPKREILKR